jgi:hypothetical protein
MQCTFCGGGASRGGEGRELEEHASSDGIEQRTFAAAHAAFDLSLFEFGSAEAS